MNEVSLELETLRLNLADDRLCLITSSSVTLRTPNTLLSHLSRTRLIELLTSGDVWVSRGSGCRLELMLHFEDALLPGIQKDFLDALEQLILDSPIWNSLGLEPETQIADSQPKANRQVDLIVTLHYALPSNDQGGVTNLPTHTAFYVKAPECTQSADLEKIAVLVSYKTISDQVYRSSKRRKLMLKSSSNAFASLQQNSEVLRDTKAWTYQRVLSDESDQTKSESSRQTLAELDLIGEDMDDTDLLYHIDALVPSLGSLSGTGPTLDLACERAESDTYQSQQKTGIGGSRLLSVLSAYGLLETALRYIIGGQQIKRLPGVNVETPSPRYTLSDICPCMWSPGFLQSMASRAPYIPKIASILSNTVTQNAQSPSLRRKLARFKSTHQASSDNLAGENLPETFPSIDRMETVLARIGRLVLYDPTSARRLPPSEMIDTTCTTCYEDEHKTGEEEIDIDEFDDMGSENSETDMIEFDEDQELMHLEESRIDLGQGNEFDELARDFGCHEEDFEDLLREHDDESCIQSITDPQCGDIGDPCEYDEWDHESQEMLIKQRIL